MSVNVWGTIPAWFSAVGTTGALAATIGIIVRDRRKDARTDAARLACWFERPGADEADYSVDQEHTGSLRVRNDADRPVYDVVVMVGPDDRMAYVRKHLTHVLSPDEEATFAVPFRTVGIVSRPPIGPAAVEFQDVDNVSWVRDLENHTLVRRRKRRLRRYLGVQKRYIAEFKWNAFNPRFRRRIAPPKRPDWRR